MTANALQEYAQKNWVNFTESYTEISKSNDSRTPLIQSDLTLYNFDAICATMFPSEKMPTSADGIAITGKYVEVVEFKSGFKQQITKRNFNEEKGRCEYKNEVCDDYWNLFWENQKKRISELISSVRIKAIESYITLEKHIFPCCHEPGLHVPLKYVVVIDADSVDSMEDTLAELACKKDVEDNHINSIKKALCRLANRYDANGIQYFYDEIAVMSAEDFQSHLHLLAKSLKQTQRSPLPDPF